MSINNDPDMRPPVITDCGEMRPIAYKTVAVEEYTIAEMTVRVVDLAMVGVGIEIGPYCLDYEDVEVLRVALADYDYAVPRHPVHLQWEDNRNAWGGGDPA